MRQISRLAVIAVSTALLMTLSSCSGTQSTPEADDQPSTPTEKREMTTDVPESNNASGKSPQGSVTDAANFEITENEDGTVTISRYTALLSVTGQNGHSADCPGVPLRGSKS